MTAFSLDYFIAIFKGQKKNVSTAILKVRQFYKRHLKFLHQKKISLSIHPISPLHKTPVPKHDEKVIIKPTPPFLVYFQVSNFEVRRNTKDACWRNSFSQCPLRCWPIMGVVKWVLYMHSLGCWIVFLLPPHAEGC